MTRDYKLILKALREVTEIIERCDAPTDGHRAESIAAICREKGLNYHKVTRFINGIPEVMGWPEDEKELFYDIGISSPVDSFYSFIFGSSMRHDEDTFSTMVPVDAVDLIEYICSHPKEFNLKENEARFVELCHLEGYNYIEAWHEIMPEGCNEQTLTTKVYRKLRSDRIRSKIMLGLEGWEEYQRKLAEAKEELVQKYIAQTLEKDEEIRGLQKQYRLADRVIDMIMLLEGYSDPGEIGSMALADLELSARTYNAFDKAGMSTIRDLVKHYHSVNDLSTVRNAGKKSVEEIIAAVRKYYPDWLAEENE